MPAMSNDRSERGRLGEEYAARLLEREGYRILSRNFRTRYGEIDLIAQKGEILAFVEVKAGSFWPPRVIFNAFQPPFSRASMWLRLSSRKPGNSG